MSALKSDLICEIIRKSQTNLLKKKTGDNGDCNEQLVLHWVKNNAKSYRDYYCDQLSHCSTSELGVILKELQESMKDLNDLLINSPSFVEKV